MIPRAASVQATRSTLQQRSQRALQTGSPLIRIGRSLALSISAAHAACMRKPQRRFCYRQAFAGVEAPKPSDCYVALRPVLNRSRARRYQFADGAGIGHFLILLQEYALHKADVAAATHDTGAAQQCPWLRRSNK